MTYHITKTIETNDFEKAKELVTEALKNEGFGILTEIDIQATMKKKLDKDYKPFLILGACNPHFADQLLGIDPNMSAMLPCNVTLRQLENGKLEVSAMDPVAAIAALGSKSIEPIAKEVKLKLEKAVNSIT